VTITHLNAVLAQLRIAESMEGMPAGAMHHIQKAIARIERKIGCIEKVLAAHEAA
jgi:hypothetical protein